MLDRHAEGPLLVAPKELHSLQLVNEQALRKVADKSHADGISMAVTRGTSEPDTASSNLRSLGITCSTASAAKSYGMADAESIRVSPLGLHRSTIGRDGFGTRGVMVRGMPGSRKCKNAALL